MTFKDRRRVFDSLILRDSRMCMLLHMKLKIMSWNKRFGCLLWNSCPCWPKHQLLCAYECNSLHTCSNMLSCTLFVLASTIVATPQQHLLFFCSYCPGGHATYTCLGPCPMSTTRLSQELRTAAWKPLLHRRAEGRSKQTIWGGFKNFWLPCRLEYWSSLLLETEQRA